MRGGIGKDEGGRKKGSKCVATWIQGTVYLVSCVHVIDAKGDEWHHTNEGIKG